jgi:hypothetical protein
VPIQQRNRHDKPFAVHPRIFPALSSNAFHQKFAAAKRGFATRPVDSIKGAITVL